MIGGGLQTPCDIASRLIVNKGSALFDGTNDFVNASSVASDLSMTAGTVSLWARITTTSNNESFFNCSDGDSGSNKFSIFYLTSSGILRGNYKFGGTAVNVEHSISNGDIVAAGWFHLALTYDTGNNSLILYFNGTAVATSTASLTAIDTSSVTIDRVRLGKNSNADNTFHQGYIDEYAYFARVLSAAEIARIHSRKGKINYAQDLDLKGTANQLKQWLRFGDGKLGITNDQAASTFTGVIFDMSNATLGSELIVNGDYSNGLTNWNTYGTTSVAGGVVTIGPTSNSGIWQQILTTNDFYIAQVNVVSFDPGESEGLGQIVNNNGAVLHAITSTGLQTFAFRHAINDQHFLIRATNNSTLKINSVSVKKIQGNPAFTDGAIINQDNLPG